MSLSYLFLIDERKIGCGNLIFGDEKILTFDMIIIQPQYKDYLPVFFNIYACEKYNNDIIYNKYFDCYFSNFEGFTISFKDNIITLILEGVDIIYGYRE